jgi:hypothetical protein
MSGDHRKGRTDQLHPKEVMTLADLSSAANRFGAMRADECLLWVG